LLYRKKVEKMVQYAKPKKKPRTREFVIDPSQTKDVRLFLDRIMDDRKNKVKENKTAKKKRNFLLLYYRECLRFCLYKIMNLPDLAGKSVDLIDIMAREAKSFKVSDNTLKKVGVIAALMICSHADEGALKDNINKISKEILKIKGALDKDAESLYKKYTAQYLALK
jgi:hypothetical protein